MNEEHDGCVTIALDRKNEIEQVAIAEKILEKAAAYFKAAHPVVKDAGLTPGAMVIRELVKDGKCSCCTCLTRELVAALGAVRVMSEITNISDAFALLSGISTEADAARRVAAMAEIKAQTDEPS